LARRAASLADGFLTEVAAFVVVEVDEDEDEDFEDGDCEDEDFELEVVEEEGEEDLLVDLLILVAGDLDWVDFLRLAIFLAGATAVVDF
jgi:hypothetical protein